MRKMLITALVVLGPVAAHAQSPQDINSNQYLRDQLSKTQMVTREMDRASCVEMADDLAHTSLIGYKIDVDTPEQFTVRIFEDNNKILRITCYQGNMFWVLWTQTRK